MSQSFDRETWRERVAAWWQEKAPDWKGAMERLGVETAYGLLTASAWLPFLSAYGKDPGRAVLALTEVLGGIGTNLLSNLIEGAYDKATAPREVEQEVIESPDLRSEHHKIIGELGVLSSAHKALGQDWPAFSDRLGDDMIALGGYLDTQGGNAILGDVEVSYGDVVLGNKVIVHIHPPEKEEEKKNEHTTLGLRAYLSWVRRQNLPLVLAGIDPAYGSLDREEMSLAEVYADLQASESKVSNESQDGSAVDVVAQSQYTVVLGGAGSGKSTLLRYIALSLASRYLETEREWAERLSAWPSQLLIPIYVSLAEFASDLPEGDVRPLATHLWKHMVTSIDRRLRDLEGLVEVLKGSLRQGNCVVLLDGLDEVPRRSLEPVRSCIANFIKEPYAGNRFILTCRTLSYTNAVSIGAFRPVTLAPLDYDLIHGFVEVWHGELVRRRGLASNKATTRAKQFCDTIRHSPELLSLARNPMLLTLLVRVAHDSGGYLPINRAKLYEECEKLLLLKWQSSKGGNILAEVGSEIDVRKAIWEIAYLAHEKQMSLGTLSRVEESEAAKAIVRHLGGYHKVEEFLDYVEQRAGLLESVGESPNRTLGFVHPVFQEYLAGCHLSVLEDKDFLESVGGLSCTDHWHNAILLAAERLIVLGYEAKALELASHLCPEDLLKLEKGWHSVVLAAEILLRFRATRLRSSGLGRSLCCRVTKIMRVATELGDGYGGVLRELEELSKTVGEDSPGLPKHRAGVGE